MLYALLQLFGKRQSNAAMQSVNPTANRFEKPISSVDTSADAARMIATIPGVSHDAVAATRQVLASQVRIFKPIIEE